MVQFFVRTAARWNPDNGDLQLTHNPSIQWGQELGGGSTNDVIKAHLDGEYVGKLMLGHAQSKFPGRVEELKVHPDHRGKGIATEMMTHAQELGLNPTHSSVRTDEGNDFAKATPEFGAVKRNNKMFDGHPNYWQHPGYYGKVAFFVRDAAQWNHDGPDQLSFQISKAPYVKDNVTIPGYDKIHAFVNNVPAGHMLLAPQRVGPDSPHGPGEIADIQVHQDFRLKGLAREMAYHAQENDLWPKHSDTRTPDGDAFAKATPELGFTRKRSAWMSPEQQQKQISELWHPDEQARRQSISPIHPKAIKYMNDPLWEEGHSAMVPGLSHELGRGTPGTLHPDQPLISSQGAAATDLNKVNAIRANGGPDNYNGVHVMQHEDGSHVVIDGHHRLLSDRLDGKSSPVTIHTPAELSPQVHKQYYSDPESLAPAKTSLDLHTQFYNKQIPGTTASKHSFFVRSAGYGDYLQERIERDGDRFGDAPKQKAWVDGMPGHKPGQQWTSGYGHDPANIAWVATNKIAPYREHNGNMAGESPANVEALKESTKAEGWKSPLTIDYHPESHKATLAEGNHRLAAAIATGQKYVPVTVTKSRYPDYKQPAQFPRPQGDIAWHPQMNAASPAQVLPTNWLHPVDQYRHYTSNNLPIPNDLQNKIDLARLQSVPKQAFFVREAGNSNGKTAFFVRANTINEALSTLQEIE